MAHSPEQPVQYVCDACQVVHAGTVVNHTDGAHEYEPPASCGACGGDAFTELVDWPHRHE